MSVPMQKTKTAFDTAADYLRALEEATAKTKMEQDKDKTVKKEETERKKKYDSQMAKVKELEEHWHSNLCSIFSRLQFSEISKITHGWRSLADHLHNHISSIEFFLKCVLD